MLSLLFKVSILVIIVSAIPINYEFFLTSRLVCAVVLGLLSFISFIKDKITLGTLSLILALIYQPIKQIFLPYNLWIAISFLSIVFLSMCYFISKLRERNLY